MISEALVIPTGALLFPRTVRTDLGKETTLCSGFSDQALLEQKWL
jgi:hypothetical protein